MTWNSELMRNQTARRPCAAAMNGRLATVRAIAALTIFVLAVCSGTFRPAHAQGVQLLKVDVSVVASGYRASKLIGANVKNDK